METETLSSEPLHYAAGHIITGQERTETQAAEQPTQAMTPAEIHNKAVGDTCAWLMRTRDELEYYGVLRKDTLPLPSMANLRLALTYAQYAHDYANHGNLPTCQANVDKSIEYYGLFTRELQAAQAEMQRKQSADAESQRMATAQASAEREPVVVNVEVPLTVNPVINRASMRVVRDEQNLVKTIEPVGG